MKKNISYLYNLLIVVLFACLSVRGYSQKASIKGVITDTSIRKKLEYAVVALINNNDSSLVTFTRTHVDGSFLMEGLHAGNYTLMITAPQAADFIQPIRLQDTSAKNIGNINMTSRVALLQEVIVLSAAAIRMKGDTLEYKADSFATKQGATLEDLLKRLPGIEVSRDGKIKAQGEDVTTVLVDGDEFFGDDPLLATKYLQAKSVDKVQVFNKKSDQATFTGIDDGKHSKTINIKLKENSKQGYFGKLSSGTNAKNFYNQEGMFNKFSHNLKVSVFGIASNTGQIGLSYQDRSQYVGNDLERIDDDGGTLLFGNDSYESSTFYSSGLPTSTYAGAQFSDKWNSAKQKVNGNYRYKNLSTVGWQKSNYTQILPDSSVRVSSSSSNTNSWQIDHKIGGTFDAAIDSFASIKVTIQGSQRDKNSTEEEYSETKNGKDGNFLNTSNRENSTVGNGKHLNVGVLWRQKFRKERRTLSLNLQESNDNNTNSLTTNAVNQLFDATTHIATNENPNQLQKNLSTTNAYAGKLAYTEPLSKAWSAEISYAFKLTDLEKDRTVFSKDTNKIYNLLVDSLSSKYHYITSSHMPGLMLQYAQKKFNFSAGGKLSFTDLKQESVATATNSRTFVNFFPQARLTIPFKMSRNFSLNYNGRTRQPSINELQPLKDKSNSLTEYLGNPDLVPSFTHTLSANFFDYNFLSGKSFFFGLNYSLTQNEIITTTDYAAFNKTVVHYTNKNGNSNISGYFSFDKSIGKKGLKWGINGNAYLSNSVSIVNKVNIINKSRNLGFGPSLSFNKTDKYSIEIRSTLNYMNSVSSSSSTGSVTNLSHNHTITGTVYLPWKIDLTTDADLRFQPANRSFNTSNNIFKWNASITKKWNKAGTLETKASVIDILNQATGYSRYSSGNSLSETTSNYIPRYFLLTATWNFSHTHK